MKKFLAFLIALLALATGCKRFGIASVELDSEPMVPHFGEGYLMFDLYSLAGQGGAQRYDCTFNSEGKTAHFQYNLVFHSPSLCYSA